ncbi:ABC transporter substrate-binding protein [Rhizobium laguerreae]|uniref:ABC transporter substrate-binding protein n=1 Tax=Rhizobium laguerreae TaxID=1076926 RepID=UPI001C91E507|nr:ABC transporter substrate-binding protein [Rhizobium laguerreae]MBY3307613.1 ABC transporter substrate-binding protein [Rhizobium laguerreae]
MMRLLTVSVALVAFSGLANAQTVVPEKKQIHLAAAGLGFPYLPFIIADHRGYFKDEGLEVDIGVYAGGAKALQALLGGSADVVAGAYSNTITMATKGQKLVSFVVQANCPDWVFGVTKGNKDKIKTIADLKGKRIGVSSPGSSFHMGVNYLLTQAGVKPDEVSIIGVGSSATAVAAVREGQIDAIMANDPVATILQDSGDLSSLAEMRTVEGNRTAFGGDYTEAAVYASKDFVDRNPKTVQGVTNAVVHAEQWLAQATPEQVFESVPQEYFVNDKAVFSRAFTNMRRCLSTNGLMSDTAAKTVRDVLAAFDPTIGTADIDLDATYDNSFAQRAPKY